jgi:hypothetical protein
MRVIVRLVVDEMTGDAPKAVIGKAGYSAPKCMHASDRSGKYLVNGSPFFGEVAVFDVWCERLFRLVSWRSRRDGVKDANQGMASKQINDVCESDDTSQAVWWGFAKRNSCRSPDPRRRK